MNRTLLGVFFLLFAVPYFSVHAAALYMNPSTAEINRGDTIKVSVRLDTDEDECVNVVDGVIRYSKNIELIDISRGPSILSVWVEDPKIDKQNRTVTFAGGIPNGYCGRIDGDPRLTNVVLDLLFQSPGFVIGAENSTSSKASILFDEQTQVLKNDGFGTRSELRTSGAEIILLNNAGSQIDNQWKDIIDNDNTSPEKFSITLTKIPDENGRHAIIFNTTDKQSGIDHYEVIEEPINNADSFLWGSEGAPWKEVRSPYILKDQSLQSIIRVKAIDKAGNEYVATYKPSIESPKEVKTQTKIGLYIILAVILFGLLSLLIFGIIWFIRRKRRGQEEVLEEGYYEEGEGSEELEEKDE